MWAMMRLCLAITNNVIPCREEQIFCPGRPLRIMGLIALNPGLAGSFLQGQPESYLYWGWTYKCQGWNTELATCQTTYKGRCGQPDAWLVSLWWFTTCSVPTTCLRLTSKYGPTKCFGWWPRVSFLLLYSVRTSKCFLLEIFPNYPCVAVDTNFTLKECGCQFLMTKGRVLGILAKRHACKKGLGHHFTVKQKCLHLSRVLLPGAQWLPGCFLRFWMTDSKEHFSMEFGPRQYKNYISSRQRTVKDCTN